MNFDFSCTNFVIKTHSGNRENHANEATWFISISQLSRYKDLKES